MDTPIADVKLENLIRFWMYFVGSPHNKTRFIHAVDGCEILQPFLYLLADFKKHETDNGIITRVSPPTNWCRRSQPSTVCLMINGSCILTLLQKDSPVIGRIFTMVGELGVPLKQ